ncbi:MAG: SUMF1/EgtB/PvdO family nonheme iron enzyme [Verrucomicrobiota bacterium]
MVNGGICVISLYLTNIPDTSNNPSIPDFEILGRIGGGAYGEVFLARSVTGMYRAVKVVSREDFEYERTFEREFQGIQRYEQVSKDHPGLVDVLHVGRDDEAGFYYYVMELADDETDGSEEVDPSSYRAKTLSSELKDKGQLSVLDTVKLGISLANALGHLHQAGLTHRDVKPSNIIFVKDKPKLADVGLVAATGQKTFVGTEGYVPPEGPGTSAADLYSLAMVLYEAHTRKDRLDFPELPTNLEIPPTVNRDQWRALNTVICRGGSPDARKRFATAKAFAIALREVVDSGDSQKGRSPGRKGRGILVSLVMVLLVAVLGVGGYWVWQDSERFRIANADQLGGEEGSSGRDQDETLPDEEGAIEVVDAGKGNESKGTASDEGSQDAPMISDDAGPDGSEVANQEEGKPPQGGSDGSEVTEGGNTDDREGTQESDETEPKPDREIQPPVVAEVVKGQVKLISVPSGAAVWIDGEEVGITPRPLEFPVGPVELVLRYPGHFDYEFQGEVVEGFQILNLEMIPDRRPQPGAPWQNSLGMQFLPTEQDGFVSEKSVSGEAFIRFMEETGRVIPISAPFGIVQVRDEMAQWEFCDWVTALDRESGYLDSETYYRPTPGAESLSDDSFKLVKDDRFGTLLLNSEPSGAKVIQNGRIIGQTPMTLSEMRQGRYRLKLDYPGHELTEIVDVLSGLDPMLRLEVLRPDASVVFGEPWTNSQGMPLQPVNGVMVAAFETAVRHFQDYIAEMQIPMPSASIQSVWNHPVVGLTRNEAEAFCDWLTLREQSMGLIRPQQRYRLPTDREWSDWAGLPLEPGEDPQSRSQSGTQSFPWGQAWPPPVQSGNFADLAAVNQLRNYVIDEYNDGFAATSPVGSFPPDANGLYDLSGNVWEWVGDSFQKGNPQLGVLRGGGWNTYERERLAMTYRNAVPANVPEDFYGFRYVLEDLIESPRAEAP